LIWSLWISEASKSIWDFIKSSMIRLIAPVSITFWRSFSAFCYLSCSRILSFSCCLYFSNNSCFSSSSLAISACFSRSNCCFSYSSASFCASSLFFSFSSWTARLSASYVSITIRWFSSLIFLMISSFSYSSLSCASFCYSNLVFSSSIVFSLFLITSILIYDATSLAWASSYRCSSCSKRICCLAFS
jgi:hypothetical protein